MGRKAHFQREDFIRAALDILSDKGLPAITISAIASRINAPVGSVYHRFKSRELLLAELWLELIESFQNGFITILHKGDIENAALYTLKWVRKHPNKARVLLLHRREELMSGPWPDSLKSRAGQLADNLDKAIRDCTIRLFGKASKEAIARIVFSLIQAPTAAVRPFLERGDKVPRFFDSIIRETCRSIISKNQDSSASQNPPDRQ